MRSSCVGPRPPEIQSRSSREPFAQRRLEIGGVVSDDGYPGRIDPEPKQRRGEVRAVPVVAVAADELGARRDDEPSGSPLQAGCQPVAVTTITCGFGPGTCTGAPRISIRRFSGVSIETHSRLPRIATAPSLGWIVPS